MYRKISSVFNLLWLVIFGIYFRERNIFLGDRQTNGSKRFSEKGRLWQVKNGKQKLGRKLEYLIFANQDLAINSHEPAKR